VRRFTIRSTVAETPTNRKSGVSNRKRADWADGDKTRNQPAANAKFEEKHGNTPRVVVTRCRMDWQNGFVWDARLDAADCEGLREVNLGAASATTWLRRMREGVGQRHLNPG
jgi:hypothetical protein